MRHSSGDSGRKRRWFAVLGAAAAATGMVAGVFAAVGPASGDPGASPPAVTSPNGACPWLDSSLTPSRRASLLLAAMTPVQEADLLHLYWGGTTANPYEGLSPAIPQLCIPSITEQDGAAGVGSGWRTAAGRFNSVTQLPSPIADAAAFDPGLARSYGKVVGAEDAGVGVDVALAPTINIDRDPLWGRSYESLGEDPYLAASLAVPLVDGIQSQRVVAVVKHYAAYNQETGRGTKSDNVIVSDRALHEIYLPAWSTTIQQARPGGVMCAYDLINGVPSCQDTALLADQLRGAWGFAGFVRSDCGSIFDQSASFAAGVSQVKCTKLYQPAEIAAAVSAGTLPKPALDSVVRPLLQVLFRFDLIASPHQRQPDANVSSSANQAVALQAADEAAVLLKNDGVLPLAPSATVALIGARGGSPMTAGLGAMHVRANQVTTALDAFQDRFGSRLSYTGGASIAVAQRIARTARVAVVVVYDVESEGHDRTTLSLPYNQDALVRAVAAVNPHTVVVIESGAPVYTPWLHSVGAVLETWYPGQAAGRSLVDLLTGTVDPSGKLPVSWPTPGGPRPDSAPSEFASASGPTQYAEGIDVGYRWYQAAGVEPQFPFGFGLSYTRFRFSNLRVKSGNGPGFTVTARVTNVGTRAGAEVAQCYVGLPAATGEPARQLRGFARVDLAPGKSAPVRFAVSAGDLATWSGAPGTVGTWAVTAGRYEVYVGDASSLAHLPLRASVNVRDAQLGPAGGPGPLVGAPTGIAATSS
ncbi:MAG TPA: glycoside hydrolase family 3 C-terminal domain-containing protein [Acidimicrobiales bacterium]|nr:glycoside hydrolase family 3 C-terminal domain-containing protein [Acidimicrobiales bacterium]